MKTIYKIRIGILLNQLLLIFGILILAGCSKDKEEVQPSSYLYNFSFLKQDNPGLQSDIHLRTISHKVTGTVPHHANIRQLAARFGYNGISVTINDQPQEPGVTINDFSQLVSYTVKKQDGTTENYDVDAVWFTGLPMFHISTEGGEEITSVDEYLTGNAEIAGGRNYVDISGDMKIRGRGHSTWYFHPKKPYQLKFDDKTEVLGMPADKKWIFLAEYSDKTLMRNKLAFEMGNLSNLDWTPQSVYAEVFVNDDYRGTYNITQKVEESENRVDIGKDGYLCEIDVFDHIEPGDIYFYSSRFLIQVKEPEIDSGSTDFTYIKNYVEDFEEILYSENFSDPLTGYKSFVNVESFVDWYLINEIAKNQDSKDYSSMYFTLIPGQKMKMGPLWDFDLGFGNVDYSDCEFPTGFWVMHHAWINRMFEDPEFVLAVKERFAFFKSQEDYLLDFIDQQTNYLNRSQEENDKRWDLFGNWVWPNPVVYDSHQEEVDHLKNWLSQRIAWLDQAYSGM